MDHAIHLKNHNLSVTSVRLAVLDAIEQRPHAEAAKVFELVQEKIPTTSIQSVYNNLNTLVDSGIVREIKPKGKSALYEMQCGDGHHHMVCRSCDAVMDVGPIDTAACQSQIDTQGWQIDEVEIIFWGTCPKCLEKQAQTGENS